METGHVEPLEKSVNETFSHQVNYARRKFKQRIPKSVDGTVVANNIAALGEPNHDDSFSHSQCADNQPIWHGEEFSWLEYMHCSLLVPHT